MNKKIIVILSVSLFNSTLPIKALPFSGKSSQVKQDIKTAKKAYNSLGSILKSFNITLTDIKNAYTKNAFNRPLSPKEKQIMAVFNGMIDFVDMIKGALKKEAEKSTEDPSSFITLITLGRYNNFTDAQRDLKNQIKETAEPWADSALSFYSQYYINKLEEKTDEDGSPIYSKDVIDKVKKIFESSNQIFKNLLTDTLDTKTRIGLRFIKLIRNAGNWLRRRLGGKPIEPDQVGVETFLNFTSNKVQNFISGASEVLSNLKDTIDKNAAAGLNRIIKTAEGVEYTIQRALDGASVIVQTIIDGKTYTLQKAADGANYVVQIGKDTITSLGDITTNTDGSAKTFAENLEALSTIASELAPKLTQSIENFVTTAVKALGGLSTIFTNIFKEATPKELEAFKEYLEKEAPKKLNSLKNAQTPEEMESIIEDIIEEIARGKEKLLSEEQLFDQLTEISNATKKIVDQMYELAPEPYKNAMAKIQNQKERDAAISDFEKGEKTKAIDDFVRMMQENRAEADDIPETLSDMRKEVIVEFLKVSYKNATTTLGEITASIAGNEEDAPSKKTILSNLEPLIKGVADLGPLIIATQDNSLFVDTFTPFLSKLKSLSGLITEKSIKDEAFDEFSISLEDLVTKFNKEAQTTIEERITTATTAADFNKLLEALNPLERSIKTSLREKISAQITKTLNATSYENNKTEYNDLLTLKIGFTNSLEELQNLVNTSEGIEKDSTLQTTISEQAIRLVDANKYNIESVKLGIEIINTDKITDINVKSSYKGQLLTNAINEANSLKDLHALVTTFDGLDAFQTIISEQAIKLVGASKYNVESVKLGIEIINTFGDEIQKEQKTQELLDQAISETIREKSPIKLLRIYSIVKTSTALSNDSRKALSKDAVKEIAKAAVKNLNLWKHAITLFNALSKLPSHVSSIISGSPTQAQLIAEYEKPETSQERKDEIIKTIVNRGIDTKSLPDTLQRAIRIYLKKLTQVGTPDSPKTAERGHQTAQPKDPQTNTSSGNDDDDDGDGDFHDAQEGPDTGKTTASSTHEGPHHKPRGDDHSNPGHDNDEPDEDGDVFHDANNGSEHGR